MSDRLAVVLEVAPKKAFASALEWPGWSRSGKIPEAAIETLLAYAPRFEPVAREAGLAFPASFEVDVVEQVEGGSGTAFGVPSRIHEVDRQPVDGAEAHRQAGIVAAAWTTFDRVAAAAPAELRKGPRGGGRDRDKMVGHVIDADWYYARELGIRVKQLDPADRAAVESLRTQVLEVLRRPSDGSPLADRTWTARYAYRRIAWHALDHAWEMEDRSS
ncbi:MAG: hypothetical protein FIA92_17765 [Chloroflexi bacterium]|nr:hypothetical protein [Chloroflexota bacterium]